MHLSSNISYSTNLLQTINYYSVKDDTPQIDPGYDIEHTFLRLIIGSKGDHKQIP